MLCQAGIPALFVAARAVWVFEAEKQLEESSEAFLERAEYDPPPFWIHGFIIG